MHVISSNYKVQYVLRSGLLLLTLAIWACETDKSKVVAEQVSERVQAYSTKRLQECRQNLFLKAEHMVDSLLLAEAQGELQDSLRRLRPFRPTEPPPVPAIDSLKVAPLYR